MSYIDPETLKIIGFFLFYLLIIMSMRWLWVLSPNIEHLKEKMVEVEQFLPPSAEGDEDADPNAQKVRKILDDVIRKLGSFPDKIIRFLTGSAGTVMACWRQVHEAEVVAFELLDETRATVRLRSEIGRIASEQREKYANLVQQIELALDPVKKAEVGLEERIALLQCLTRINYESRDNNFEGLAVLTNKAFLLIISSVILVSLLMYFHPEVIKLLLYGAIGGLLAKLRGMIRQGKNAADYGASWSSLFLMPMVGAITGWAGTLMVIALGWEGIIIDLIPEGEPMDLDCIDEVPMGIAIAILFGYSASLFEKVVARFESTVESAPPKKEDSKA